jgi:hypothetical protein
MVLSKRSFVLNAFLLMHATSASAKGIRSAEREMQVGEARFYTGDAPSDGLGEAGEEHEVQPPAFTVQDEAEDQHEVQPPAFTVPDEAWDALEMQQVDAMSMPTGTPPPPPTSAPTTSPTAAPVDTPTEPLLPTLFLDEDDVFDEFGLVECQGGKIQNNPDPGPRLPYSVTHPQLLFV